MSGHRNFLSLLASPPAESVVVGPVILVSGQSHHHSASRTGHLVQMGWSYSLLLRGDCLSAVTVAWGESLPQTGRGPALRALIIKAGNSTIFWAVVGAELDFLALYLSLLVPWLAEGLVAVVIVAVYSCYVIPLDWEYQIISLALVGGAVDSWRFDHPEKKRLRSLIWMVKVLVLSWPYIVYTHVFKLVINTVPQWYQAIITLRQSFICWSKLTVLANESYSVGAAAKSAAGIETPRTTLEPTHAPIAWFFVGTRPPFTWVLFAYPAIGILCVMVARAGQPSGWSVSKVADSLNPARATTMRLRPQVGSDNLSTLEAAIMATVPTPVTPEIRLVNGQAVTTSLALANYFNKRHDDVIRKIRTLDCSLEFNARNFAAVEYTDTKGEKRIAYQLTRDGFFFVAMGFTGRRAAEFKERYIAAFNAMERQGHARYLAAPDANALAHSVSEARDFYQMIRMHWESEIYPSLKAVKSPLAYELYDRFEWMSYLLIAIAHQVESHQTAQVVQGGQHEKA
ncbi:Rha family transcriptional regulator [Aeromonas aquatilis]